MTHHRDSSNNPYGFGNGAHDHPRNPDAVGVDWHAQWSKLTGLPGKFRQLGAATAALLGFLTMLTFIGGATYAFADNECVGYEVQKGDNLYGISKLTQRRVSELVEINSIENPDLIFVGQCLTIGDVSAPAPAASQVEDTGFSTDYERAVSDSGGPQPGLVALAAALDKIWPEYGHAVDPEYGMGIYNFRNARGSSHISLHGEGRALDVYLPDCSETVMADMYEFINLAPQLGMQRVVVCNVSWTAATGLVKASDQLAAMHNGKAAPPHAHLESSWDSAKNLTYFDAIEILSPGSAESLVPDVVVSAEEVFLS